MTPRRANYLAHRAAELTCSRKYHDEHREELIAYARLYNAKARAKAAGLPFSITAEDVVPPSHCPILGIPLVSGRSRRGVSDASPTVDRLIPSLGYVKGNVIVISGRANRIKNNSTPEELRKIADFVERAIALRTAS